MVKTILIIAVLFLNLNLKSQDYISFPTENAQWNIFYVGTCDDLIPPDTTIFKYTIQGDTTINNIGYKKLLNNSVLAGCIREENKKIYFCGQSYLGDPIEEALLYDFNVQIGDTIFHNSSFYSVVKDIDSIEINHHFRKRYKVDAPYQETDYIIEGFGSINNGLIGNITDITDCGFYYWELICFTKNDTLQYLNPIFLNCEGDILSSTKSISKDIYTTISPNPTQDVIHIQSQKGITLYQLFDITGKKVKYGSESIIDMSELDNGIYFLQIVIDEHLVVLKKVIKS